MLAIYSLTLLLSAFLLFWVQLFLARMILPYLGGAPAVWNTCMLFFQAVLLVGYGYAYFIGSRLKPRRQLGIHAGLLLVPVLFLPVLIPVQLDDPSLYHPIVWLIAVLGLVVGAPFLAVSTSAPLLQHWFSLLGHRDSHDPYFLYSASNLGSSLCLLSYPLLLEPSVSLSLQSVIWSWGYVVWALLVGCCGYFLWKYANTGQAAGGRQGSGVMEPAEKAVKVGTPAQWVLLSLIPSSLLYGVTMTLTMDIAAVPLFWVIPLLLYLFSFVLAFSQRMRLPYQALVVVLPAAIIVAISARFGSGNWGLLIFLLALFFLVALTLHRWLAECRPSPDNLTKFYFWISLGGVLGGVINAILVPVLFRGAYEYFVILMLSAFVMTGPSPFSLSQGQQKLQRRLTLFALFVVSGFVIAALRPTLFWSGLQSIIVSLPLVLATAFFFKRSKTALAVTVVGVLAVTALNRSSLTLLAQQRSFFGVMRVMADDSGRLHTLFHGTTIHGAQRIEDGRAREPLAYYSRKGPIGDVFSMLEAQDRLQQVAVIGLGSGALAAYAKTGQNWVVYEIDPAVVSIAGNPEYFTYLSDMPVKPRVVVGDGRLSLANELALKTDLLVLDAFSSDSVPIHLLTQEAIDLYFSRLSSTGLLALHISNRFMNLEPVVAAIAEKTGLAARARDDWVTPERRARGVRSSNWIVLANREADLGSLKTAAEWRPVHSRKGFQPWTDDFSSIIPVLSGWWF